MSVYYWKLSLSDLDLSKNKKTLRHNLWSALLPALAGGELSTGSPHGLAGLDLHGGAWRGACKVLWGWRLLGDLLDQSTHPLLLLLLGYGQQQQVLGRRHVIVHWWRERQL